MTTKAKKSEKEELLSMPCLTCGYKTTGRESAFRCRFVCIKCETSWTRSFFINELGVKQYDNVWHVTARRRKCGGVESFHTWPSVLSLEGTLAFRFFQLIDVGARSERAVYKAESSLTCIVRKTYFAGFKNRPSYSATFGLYIVD